MKPAILANVIRGETIESVHRGHLIAIDGKGVTDVHPVVFIPGYRVGWASVRAFGGILCTSGRVRPKGKCRGGCKKASAIDHVSVFLLLWFVATRAPSFRRLPWF